MTDLTTLLNEEQFEAATAPDGPLLILAAAGTGKTRTLVYRVVHLIERGIPPEAIMLLTFTNRAAREMLERAEDVTGGATRGLWGGTFHHVANRFLRKFASKLGFRPDFTIFDAEDQRTLMGNCIKGLGFKPSEFLKRELVLSLISGATNRGLEFEDYAESRIEDTEIPLEQVIKVADEYARLKIQNNGMDFDDLLVNALRLLTEHDDARLFYQEHFQHILVDEYQDTNILQSQFIDTLGSPHKNVSVVGDDFQCIYSWRGSNYDNIMSFPDRYPGTLIVKLEQNYRSRPEILKVANASIKQNKKQFEKTLRSTRASLHAKPTVYSVYSDREQAARVIEIISKAVSAGYSYDDIAVLYRSHFHSSQIDRELTKSNIPFAVTSGIGFYEQAHIKDILALLRITIFPVEKLALMRVLQLLPGVGAVTVERIWGKLGGVFEVEKENHRKNLLAFLPAKARPFWSAVDVALEEFVANNRSIKAVNDLVDKFINLFYIKHLSQQYDNAEERKDDIFELVADIEQHYDLTEYLANITLKTNVDREKDKKDQTSEETPHVLLSTIHQAKGLEWPVVIVVWLTEGMFPSSRALLEDLSCSEERRLFYVAVTRAKDNLHLFVPRVRFMHGGGRMDCIQSRFIKEIPEELVRNVEFSFNSPGFGGGYSPSYYRRF